MKTISSMKIETTMIIANRDHSQLTRQQMKIKHLS